MRNDAEHFAGRIDDGNRDKVVLFNEADRFFTLGVRVDGNERARGLHEGADRNVLLVNAAQQVFCGDDAHEPALAVENVEVVDRLHEVRLLADLRDRFSDRHIGAQAHEVGRHFRAARVFFVGAQKGDVLLVFAREQLFDFLGDFRIDFVEQVDAVVGRRLFEELRDFVSRTRFDNANLNVAFKVTKDFRAQGGIDRAKDNPNFTGFEFLQKFSGRRRVKSRTEDAHLGGVIKRDHFAQFR